MSHTTNLDAESAIKLLMKGNNEYIVSSQNKGDISSKKRLDTYSNGQHPFALIITCSDSRVIPEAIFSKGIGDLFVIRVAGNILDEYGLASVQYAVEHLGINLVMVLGHTKCGAVNAAMGGTHTGYIESLVKEIKFNIRRATSEYEASALNVRGSIDSIIRSGVLSPYPNCKIVGAVYDIKCGKVEML